MKNTTSLNEYRADLHIHTVVSPCADVEMIPPLIVSAALDRGIDIIAITDHNSVANVGAVQRAALGTRLTVIPGMEVQTSEDVHVICLFEELEQAKKWGQIVNEHLPSINNNPDFFGEQFIVDETGDFIASENRLLLTAISMSFEQTYQAVRELGGLFIPAHVNRKAFGLIESLGFVPSDTPINTLEISRHISPEEAKKQFPQIKEFQLIQNGDVHYLADFLGALCFQIEYPSLSEIKMAFNHEKGRKYYII
ncbi:MAG: PHP domain-containing protein [Anaerolineaceae bacterium]|nr:PHP domain-containing protein [Anaerolineaceae bacterium]